MCWWFAHSELEPFGTPLVDEKAAILAYSVFRSQTTGGDLSPSDFLPDREAVYDRVRAARLKPDAAPEQQVLAAQTQATTERLLAEARRRGLIH